LERRAQAPGSARAVCCFFGPTASERLSNPQTVRRRETVPASGFACPDFKSRHVPVRPDANRCVADCCSRPAASLAEKLVGPNSVAPEFLKVAERRGAEQIKLFEAPKRSIKSSYCAGIGVRSLAGPWTGDRPIDGLSPTLAALSAGWEPCSYQTLDAFLRP